MEIGDKVRHSTFGIGTVISKWGAVQVTDPEGKRRPFYTSGEGIVDVLFEQCVHSCREEYLCKHI